MRKFGGTWSESKLDCVEKYTRSYLEVMQNQDWCNLHYVDAFAGSGLQALKCDCSRDEFSGFNSDLDVSEKVDIQEFLYGSAMRALRASANEIRQFDKFVLIDNNRSSCNELGCLIKSEHPGISHQVAVICDDAKKALEDYVKEVNWKKTRALVFLDPYGLEVDWDLIVHLAETRACDVWYLFPLGGVMRMMTCDGQIPESWKARLNRVFGTEGWFEEFYRPTEQLSLFGEIQKETYKNASTKNVVDFIRKRLQSVFPVVSEAGILRNSREAPLFALILGVSSPSPRAQKIAIKIANHLIKGLNQR